MTSVSIKELLDEKHQDFDLRLTEADKGVEKNITATRIQKLGMALTGYTKFLRPTKIQLLGNTEVSYLKTLSAKEKKARIDKVCSYDIVAIVITKDLNVPKYLIQCAKKSKIPVIRTSFDTSKFIVYLTRYLEEKLSPSTVIHGVLLEIFGIGTLILGKSGIGKSESAMDLILRGHRLVADDIVKILKRAPTVLLGSGSDLTKHHMEIRGLGIINIQDLFGSASVKDVQKLELVIHLATWDESKAYDRLGIDDEMYSILDVELPLLTIPVTPGRNMTTIIEVACRNHILKQMGCHSAQNFEKELSKKIKENHIGK
ncbi:HPr(Ser) kinase/phosphatase [Thermodesulfobacteriota bacterium]